jgi:predicted transcriptional regulator
MRKKSSVLTEQELEIMKIVWELESATVRDVYEALRGRRQIAYTTVMTMMKILEEKGHLKKWRRDRAYVYQATRPKQRVVTEMVREFVDRVFNGSAEPLVVHLVRDKRISEKDLQKIARMLREGE